MVIACLGPDGATAPSTPTETKPRHSPEEWKDESQHRAQKACPDRPLPAGSPGRVEAPDRPGSLVNLIAASKQ